MTIREIREGSTLTIMMDGRLDVITAPEFGKFLESGLDGVTDFIIDLKDLQYISSAGLREMLTAQQIMDERGSMKIVNMSEIVKEIFEETGFSDFMDIEDL
jgi:anti-sigma B factor antagonist